MAARPEGDELRMRKVAALLTGIGLLFICAGVIVGFFVAPIGFIGVAIGVIDLVVARQFAEERRGNVIIPGEEPEADPDTIAAESGAATEPNPYARED